MATEQNEPDGSSIVRLTAPNPSPMTLDGTNSYVLFGAGEALVIDPGPSEEPHLRALAQLVASRGSRVTAIAVTHGHPDHAPGAAYLSALTGAPVYAHPAAGFPYDRGVPDRGSVSVAGAALLALHAPGHARDHLVFWFAPEAALFTGDVVIGRGTVLIAPPGGDMRAYQATLRRLRDEFARARTIFGGHGERVDAPLAKIEEYLAHRELRERQIVAALTTGERTIPELVAELYRDVARALWPAAGRQVLAYLVALEREERVRGRTLSRAPRDDERAILEPDLAQLGGAAEAAVARAELGFESELAAVVGYRLAGA